MLRALVIFFGFVPFMVVAAQSHFQHVDTEWARSLHSRAGVNCCTSADGATVKDPDWGVEGDRYWVFLAGERVTVHPSAVVEGPNPTNAALVWSVVIDGKPQVKCFMPGHLT